jgi:hypothetical protein
MELRFESLPTDVTRSATRPTAMSNYDARFLIELLASIEERCQLRVVLLIKIKPDRLFGDGTKNHEVIRANHNIELVVSKLQVSRECGFNSELKLREPEYELPDRC